MTRQIAVFGGAFDPPHLGHQAVCLYVFAIEEIDEVWWVPSVVHAFGKRTAPYEHRVAMCRLAARHFDPARVRVSTVEAELSSPQHTVDTVAHLHAREPEARFSVVIGSDNLDDLHRWKEIDRLRSLAPFVVVPRAGHALAEAEGALLPEISSRDLRARLARGEDTGQRVDREVGLYIEAHGLYKGARGGEQ
jgi:nicotinate-nucleotide adenylyltransferase